MSILKVARLGHPVLRAKARPIDRALIATSAVQQLIDNMFDTMQEYHGIGLAAPQVHESVRIFVAGLEKEDERTGETSIVPMAIVNPEITPLGRDLVEDWEGCLSIPDIRGKVPRNRRVRVRGFGRDGEPLDMELEDFQARVFQHEHDHLNGVLFLDRMKSFDTLAFLDEYSRFWANDKDEP
jgi:peptide deformylase